MVQRLCLGITLAPMSRTQSLPLSSNRLHSADAAQARPRPSDSERRRALVNNVLMEVMRRVGVPSDWLGCNAMEAVSRNGRPRMIVQLIVHKGDNQLIPVMTRLQETLKREIEKQDLASRDWLAAIAWEFRGERDPAYSRMPAPEFWAH